MGKMDTVESDIFERMANLEEELKSEAWLEQQLTRETYEIKETLLKAYHDKVKEYLQEENKTYIDLEKAKRDEAAKLVKKDLLAARKEYEKALAKATSETDKKNAKADYERKVKEIKALEKIQDEGVIRRAKLKVNAEKKQESMKALGGAFKGMKLNKEFFSGLKDTFKDAFSEIDENGNKKFSALAGINVLSGMLANYAQQLKGTINDIASNKTAIDTRLQGWTGKTKAGSYWDQISGDVTGIAGVSPLIKQETFVANIKNMVSQGIAFNVEQRAFLATISDKIATTFDANNAALSKLIRIQQQDSTAARLGMESALTQFLNNMYETSEYMQSVAQSIKDSLLEAESLMGTKSAAAFEYQVQKWMGSMYSVGASQNAVSGIANSLGQLVAGNVEGITGGGFGNLLVMAANNAGISVAEALSNGLTTEETNSLLKALTEYVQGIYNETKDSRVVQQQYAKVFGLTASDLKALSNLNINDLNTIYGKNMSYDNMLSHLNTMANSMYKRTSQAELLTNLTSNLQYSMAAGIANNPVLYGLYTMSNMLTDMVGGIDFSLPLVMGTGTAQTFNIAELMRAGAMSGGIMSSLGKILGGGGGLSGSGMLRSLGIGSGISNVTRGNGGGAGYSSGSGVGVSESGYVGNSSSSDIQNKSMSDVADEQKAKTAEAKEEDDSVELKDVNKSILDIYDILNTVFNGNALKVTLSAYDTTGWH